MILDMTAAASPPPIVHIPIFLSSRILNFRAVSQPTLSQLE